MMFYLFYVLIQAGNDHWDNSESEWALFAKYLYTHKVYVKNLQMYNLRCYVQMYSYGIQSYDSFIVQA